MKFCFRVSEKAYEQDGYHMISELFEGLNKAELIRYLGTLKPGTRMHLVVRPRPGFDVTAKRNYFHGPMLDWICQQLHDMGLPNGREALRKELKRKFIGEDEKGNPLSTTTLEHIVEGDPRDPETKYGQFLSEIRMWCIDIFGMEPPRPDDVDLAEEQTSWATPPT